MWEVRTGRGRNTPSSTAASSHFRGQEANLLSIKSGWLDYIFLVIKN